MLYNLYHVSWCGTILWDDAVRHELWVRGTVILHTKALEALRGEPSFAPRNPGRHRGGYTSLGIAAVSTPNRLQGGVDMRGFARLNVHKTGLAPVRSQRFYEGRGPQEMGGVVE